MYFKGISVTSTIPGCITRHINGDSKVYRFHLFVLTKESRERCFFWEESRNSLQFKKVVV